MSRCVIISACPVSPELAEALRPDDFIIACDAGYRNCAPLGRRPNIIVGDFDTAPCPEQQDDDIIVLPHVKDDTDTEYAAKLVSEKGFDEVLLLGGLGGRRVEHTLANLCTGLGLEQRGVRTTLLDERSRITYVMPGETRRYPKEKYFFFSAFPMEGRAQGVCERGSYYELTDAELTASYPLGVSNEYAASPSPPAAVRLWWWRPSQTERCCPCRNVPAPACIGWARKRKGGEHMQVVVIRSPKALRGILRRLFGIQKQ